MRNLFNRRLFLGLLLGFFSKLQTQKSFGEGNPFRDRFQSYRQTFRIEPDKEEAERIVKNIINGRELVSNLIKLDVPDIAEDGNVVPVSFSINCSMTGDDFRRECMY